MKKLLISLVFFCFGCSPSQKDIRSIEFIFYNWDLKYPTEFFKGEFYIQPKTYSILNLNGENQTYVCEFSPNKKEVYFNSKVDSRLVTDLVNFLSILEENEVFENSYRQDGCMESSSMYRLKVVYANKEEKFYHYYGFEKKNKADLAIRKLYFALRMNQMEGNFEIMKDTLSFASKKKELVNFSMQKDTLITPLPALPIYNKVKFKR